MDELDIILAGMPLIPSMEKAVFSLLKNHLQLQIMSTYKSVTLDYKLLQAYTVALKALSTKDKWKLENIFRDLLIYLEASTVQMQPESQRALLITNDNIFYRQFGRHKAVLELLSKSAREAI